MTTQEIVFLSNIVICFCLGLFWSYKNFKDKYIKFSVIVMVPVACTVFAYVLCIISKLFGKLGFILIPIVYVIVISLYWLYRARQNYFKKHQ